LGERSELRRHRDSDEPVNKTVTTTNDSRISGGNIYRETWSGEMKTGSQAYRIVTRGGAGIHACGKAAEEIGFSR
jgi:hypothetical protein